MSKAATIAGPVDQPSGGGDQPDPTALTEIVDERERLHAEHGRLAKIDSSVAEVEQRLAEVRVASGAIDAAEQAAFAEWAAGGAVGPAPQTMLDERQKIDQRRVLITADLASAHAARAGVQPRLKQIAAELSRIEISIARHRASEAVQRATSTAHQIDQLVDELKDCWHSTMALREAAIRRAAQATQADNRALAAVFTKLAEDIEQLRLPVLEWKRAAVDACIADWLTFFAEGPP